MVFSLAATSAAGLPLWRCEQCRVGRLKEDFPRSAVPDLADYARSSSKFLRDKGIVGLQEVGGRDAIQPLIEIGDSSIPDAWRRPTAALRTVMQSLDGSDVPEYLAGIQASRQLPFDIETYETVAPALLVIDSDTFASMLGSSSEAARFTAAFRLAAGDDLRAVPVLLEALRVKVTAPIASLGFLNVYVDSRHRISSTAVDLVKQLRRDGKGTLDPALLEPYLPGGDKASAYAAQFMILADAEVDILARLRAFKPAHMRAMLPQLARLLSAPGNIGSARVEALVSTPQMSWLRSMLQDSDEQLRLDAALLLANRGDPAGLLPTLALLRIQEKCGWLSLGRLGPCYQFEEPGNAVLDQLAMKIAASIDLSVQPADLEGLSVHAYIRLARLFTRVGIDGLIKALIDAYAAHNDAELYSSWPMESIAQEMAEALPEHITDWTIDRAMDADATRVGDALARLAEQMIRINTQCGTIMLDSPNLKELARRCRQQKTKAISS